MVRFRITYATYQELAADVQQMAHGGVLVRGAGAGNLTFDDPVELELAFPDGTSLVAAGKVIQVLAGHGVAVSVTREVAERARQIAATGAGEPAATVPPKQVEEPTNAQKIQLALHGNRDQRNAILRDRNRMLHSYVLKNPGINVDDVLSIAKNAQMGPEVFKLIAERQDWFQRPQIALALARNPKVPGEIAVRALAFVAPDALRQLAKGTGAPPHVVQAARKRVLGS
jgi:hypothetical protein